MKKMGNVLLMTGMFLFFAGCGSPYYYDLQNGIPENTSDLKLEKVLMVEDVEINETYRNTQLVCRGTPFKVTYHHTASWSKSPEELIEDAVILFLKKRALFKKVDTGNAGADPDWTMRIRIEAIERIRVQKNWYARLAMDVEIADVESNATILIHTCDRKSLLEKNRIGLVPEKISQILHEELLKIEAKLRERLE